VREWREKGEREGRGRRVEDSLSYHQREDLEVDRGGMELLVFGSVGRVRREGKVRGGREEKEGRRDGGRREEGGGRENGRKGGREEGRKGGREEGRKGGREEGRKGGRKGGRRAYL
jgi:hypothetical protein